MALDLDKKTEITASDIGCFLTDQYGRTFEFGNLIFLNKKAIDSMPQTLKSPSDIEYYLHQTEKKYNINFSFKKELLGSNLPKNLSEYHLCAAFLYSPSESLFIPYLTQDNSTDIPFPLSHPKYNLQLTKHKAVATVLSGALVKILRSLSDTYQKPLLIGSKLQNYLVIEDYKTFSIMLMKLLKSDLKAHKLVVSTLLDFIKTGCQTISWKPGVSYLHRRVVVESLLPLFSALNILSKGGVSFVALPLSPTSSYSYLTMSNRGKLTFTVSNLKSLSSIDLVLLINDLSGRSSNPLINKINLMDGHPTMILWRYFLSEIYGNSVPVESTEKLVNKIFDLSFSSARMNYPADKFVSDLEIYLSSHPTLKSGLPLIEKHRSGFPHSLTNLLSDLLLKLFVSKENAEAISHLFYNAPLRFKYIRNEFFNTGSQGLFFMEAHSKDLVYEITNKDLKPGSLKGEGKIISLSTRLASVKVEKTKLFDKLK